MSRSQYSGMPRCHSVQVQCSHDGTPWAFDIIIVCVIVTRPVVPLRNLALFFFCLEKYSAWVLPQAIGYIF